METSNDYKSGNCSVDYCSEMTSEQAENLIGKTILKVDASEYSILLTFTDGGTLDITGWRWEGCCLGIDCS